MSFEVGKFDRKWWAFAFPFLLLAALGAYAFYEEVAHGLIMTGMRTIGRGGSGWGLYIMFDIYFVGVSFAGITVAALIRLFNIKILEPLSRIAELLAVFSLLLSIPCIFADLGRPLKGLMYLPMYARAMSPFFGTFTMVAAGYFFASLLFLYLAGRADAAYCASHVKTVKPLQWFYKIWASGCRGTKEELERHHRVSFWLALAILPLLVTAHSSLGAVFGIQVGRPGWYNALQPPEFVILAGVSGVGALIVVTAFLRKIFNLEEIKPDAFKWLSNFLWILIVAYLYFMIVDELTANYASPKAERSVAHEIAVGAYSWEFWTVVACLVIPFLILFAQFALGKYKISLAVVSGILVNVSAVLKRFLIVVPSQTHGMLLPYQHGIYHPTWVEFSIVIGVASLGILLYGFFIKIFPLLPLVSFDQHRIVNFTSKEKISAFAEPKEKAASRISFWIVLLLGFAFVITGFLASARVGTKPYLDPVIPFSPILFITGIMMIFYSAAAYEIAPNLLFRKKG